MVKKFYVTTPIYYVNDKPHIGHAYTTIAADVLARYHRFLGEETFFLTGTDEHGAKNFQSAVKAGLPTQEFIDGKAAEFELAWDTLNLSYNDFIRTTQSRHHDSVKEFLRRLFKAKTPKGNPAVYKGNYEGLYCVGCESYKTEAELVDGKCPDHNQEPELVKEENWFFRLSDFTEEITKRLQAGETVVAPEARNNEVLGLLKQGLKDVAMSRNIEWGVRLPFDAEQVAWVWFDALPNYISALGYPDGEMFKKFWPASVHLMAKDILKFHTVIWMGMLLALNLPLPKMVFAHGFFTINGQKMSKTIGNVIDPVELAASYGADAVRFFLMSEFAFGSDGDVSVDKFKERYNAFLANGLGNVVARVLTLAEKYHESIKAFQSENIKTMADQAWSGYQAAMANLEFDQAIGRVWELLSWCDSYIEENKPWELAKSEPLKLGEILYNLVEIIRHLAWMIYPFMPETGEKILKALGVWHLEEKVDFAKIKEWGRIHDFSAIKKPEVLFPRQ